MLDFLAEVVIKGLDMMLVKQLSGILWPFLSLTVLKASSQRRRCTLRGGDDAFLMGAMVAEG